MENMEKIGEIVRRLRKKKGMTQSDVADLVGCDYQNIQNIETGKVTRPRYLPRLAEVFGVTVDYLIGCKTSSDRTTHLSVNDDLQVKGYDIYVVSLPKGSKVPKGAIKVDAIWKPQKI